MAISEQITWKPGVPILAPAGDSIALKCAGLAPRDIYKLMLGAIVPRPIAFISSINANGITNLAPFSFFNGVCSNPPCLSVSITRKRDGSKKDTLRNIEANGEFVINTVNEWMLGAANYCAAEFPYGVSEFSQAGLTALPSSLVKPPRVKESAVQLECRLLKSVEVGDGGVGSATLVIGQILQFHVSNSVYRDGRILIDQLKPVARLAGGAYGALGELVDLDIPPVA